MTSPIGPWWPPSPRESAAPPPSAGAHGLYDALGRRPRHSRTPRASSASALVRGRLLGAELVQDRLAHTLDALDLVLAALLGALEVAQALAALADRVLRGRQPGL
eukprot:3140606-Alexandrium_andersonii.AAC.1